MLNATRRLGLAAAIGLLLSACAPAPTGTSEEPASLTALPSQSVAGGSATADPGPTTGATTGASGGDLHADPLLATQLTDVRSGEHFALADLAAEGPILIEPMAVWCTNCRAQMHEVTRAHDAAHFVSVSLDVDLSETAQDLAAYADREGWDWRFAMASPDLYRLLQDRFGDAATYPPATPLIVIERDGSVRALDFGVGTRSPEQLLAELGLG
jgi:hypothetical protein